MIGRPPTLAESRKRRNDAVTPSNTTRGRAVRSKSTIPLIIGYAYALLLLYAIIESALAD